MKMKRLCAIPLSLALLVSSMSLTAFAASEEQFEIEDGLKYTILDAEQNLVEVAEGSSEVGQSPTYTGEITIPATVEYNEETYTVIGVGRGAFVNCYGVTKITFAEGSQVQYLGDAAFCGTKPSEITIPASVERIGTQVFGRETYNQGGSLQTITFEEGSRLTEVGQQAFQGCSSITSLDLPETVVSIGASAFAGCDALESITIPASVTNLAPGVFKDWYDEEKTITLETEHYKIQDNILWSDTELVEVLTEPNGEVIVPDGITTISAGAFRDCTGLTSIQFPETLTSIGSNAFDGCTGLTSVSLPEHLESIGVWAFEGCTSLASVSFPESLASIGEKAFYNCTALSTVSTGGRENVLAVDSLGMNAFYGTGLTSIIISGDLTEIGSNAFASCSNLASVTFESNLEKIGNNVFMNCTSLTSIDLPDTVTSIGTNAFRGSGLTSIVIPEGITEIGKSTFYGCKDLKTVVIPSSVTSVGNQAFNDWGKESSVTLIMQGTTPPTFDENAFGKQGTKPNTNNLTVIIPAGSETQYTAEGYILKDYIIAGDGEGTKPGISYSLSVTPSANSVYENNTVTLEVSSTLPTGTTLTVESSNEGVATAVLSEDGKTVTVTGVDKGTAVIAVSIKLQGVDLATESVSITVDERGTSSGDSSSGSTRYTVSVEDADNGTIKVSPTRASKGSTVTITVTPDEGYVLDELTVTDKNGDTVKLTDKGNGKYTFTMPRSAVTVEASFVAEADPDIPAFTDVPADAYYADAVAWAVENGITNGTSATTFGPNISCTRAQMVTFLWRAAGSPEPTTANNPFTDVQAGSYYYDAVLWAVEQGITEGTSATTFSPDATVTRGQTVTFLYRAAGSPEVSGGSFSDVAADAYYADAVVWAVAEGVTNGTSSTTFSPNSACTRAQIVTFMYRAAQ